MALPIIKVVPPALLAGQENGRLPESLLVSTPGLAGGPTIRLVEPAARSWRALTAAASAAGHTLKATSAGDSYRSYERQVATFVARYEPDPFPGYIGTKWWPAHYDQQGRWVTAHLWYQKPKTAVAAAPGYSNHGLGLAVDTGEESDGDAGTESLDPLTLNWLVAHAGAYGWSWENQSEPWHIRYCTGDAIPPAVLAYEATPPPIPGDDEMTQILVREGPTGPIWLCDGMLRRVVPQTWLDPNVTGPITNHRTHLTALLGNLKTGKPGTGQPGQWEGTGQIFVAGELGDEMDVWGIDVATLQGGTLTAAVHLDAQGVEQVRGIVDEQVDQGAHPDEDIPHT